MELKTEVVQINSVAALKYCWDEATGFYAVAYANERTGVRHGEAGRSFVEALERLYWRHFDFPKSHEAFIRREMKRLG